jgi:hypothetical protein
MEKSTVINYVCEHALVSETITRNTYSIRFPHPLSSRFFTANDPEGLVEKIWDFVQTSEGQKLASGYDFSAYKDENYNSDEEE